MLFIVFRGEQTLDPVLFSLEFSSQLLFGSPEVQAAVQGLVYGEGGTVHSTVKQRVGAAVRYSVV